MMHAAYAMVAARPAFSVGKGIPRLDPATDPSRVRSCDTAKYQVMSWHGISAQV